ncbi:MAG: aminoacyl-tRNA hydrolase [Christensenellales bacterium]
MRKGRLFGFSKLRGKSAAGLTADYYIIGLGNPGGRYARTRHNAGFNVVSIIAQRHGIPHKIHKYGAALGKGVISGKKVLLCMPQTYMNRSGESVKELSAALGIRADQLIIVYDDVDISSGTVRIKERGSAGSHNGLKSVIYSLNTDEFIRVRVGIGKPQGDIVDYVLGEHSDKQKAYNTLLMAADAVEAIIEYGVAEAQNRYN